MSLVVQKLSFAYHNKQIIKDISFEATNGEIVTIIGPNGSGKTTFIKCLVGINTPQEGSMLLDSHNLVKMQANSRARAIAYVPQRSEVSGITVFDLALLGRKPHRSWNIPAQDLKLAGRVLEYLGLSAISFRHTNEISGGEFQITQIARALVQQPRLIALDEPTSNLDIQNQRRIMLKIRQIVKQHNIIAVMTNHDINLSMRYSDKFILLKEGSILAYGGHEIITPENIKAIYGIDVHVLTVHGLPVIVPYEEENLT